MNSQSIEAPFQLVWKKLDNKGQLPEKEGIHGHSMVLHNDKLWIYGGSCNGWCTDQVYTYDLHDQSWSRVQTLSDPLPVCADHQAILVGDTMLCLGGRGHAQRRNRVNTGIPQPVYSHIFSINLQTCVITRLNSNFTARKGFSIVMYNNALWVYAGWNHREYFDSLYRLDLRQLGSENVVWEEVPQYGEVPQPRYGHSAHVYKNKMVTYGGTSKYSSERGIAFFDEIFMFDFTNFHWNKEQTKGAPHFGTDGHGSVLFNGGILYWGGHRCFEFDENISWLDLNTMTWYSVGSKGEVPTPRCCMQMLCRTLSNGFEEIITSGGYGPKKYGRDDNSMEEYDGSVPMEDPHIRYKDVHTAVLEYR